jgi:O-antigen/teichoic acid export membrane protein
MSAAELHRRDVLRPARRGIALRLAELTRHVATPLYRDAYALVASGASTALLGVLYWTLAARLYATEQVGLGAAAIAAMMFVSGLSQLNLKSALVRFVPVAGPATARLVAGAYAAALGCGVLAGVAFVASGVLWSGAASVISSVPGAAVGFVIATLAWSGFVLQDSVLAGLRAAVWVPVENTAFAVAKIVLLVAFAGSFPDGGIFASWALPTVAVLVPVNALIFGRLIPIHARQSGGRAMPIVRRKVARFVAGDYVGSLFVELSTSLLPILVVTAAGSAENAYFYVAWLVAYALHLIASSLAISLTVEGGENPLAVAANVRRVLAHQLRLLAPLALAIAVLAPVLLIGFGEAYVRESTTSLRLLVLAAVPYAINAVFFAQARLHGRVGEVAAVQGVIAVLVLGLAWLLLPALGPEGVALGWLIAQSSVAISLLATRLRPAIIRARQSAEAAT